MSSAANGKNVFLLNAGRVYSFGCNTYGELGRKEISSKGVYHDFGLIEGLDEIVWVSCGIHHSLHVDLEGKVYGFGLLDRQKVQRLKQNEHNEEILKDLPPIQEVYCGVISSYFKDFEGYVWVLGSNFCGQLGLGKDAGPQINIPTKLQICFTVQTIACGDEHSIMLSTDMNVYSCGNNRYGQLGFRLGANRTSPTLVQGFNNAVSIACGSYHTLVLNSNGIVFSFGRNAHGQLGKENLNIFGSLLPSLEVSKYHCKPQKIENLNDIQEIYAKGNHSICVNHERALFLFGSNESGQLGLAERQNYFLPMKMDGMEDVVSICCASTHTLLRKADGEVWKFGVNYDVCASIGAGPLRKRDLPSPVPFSEFWGPLGKSAAKSARK